MSITTSDLMIRTQVTEDQLSATLVIAGDVDRDVLNAGLIREVVDQAQVVRTDAVEAAIEALVASPPPAGITARIEIARGQRVRHGEDGRIHWLVDDLVAADADEQSFYERSAFITVTASQVLGRIIPPTPGKDGMTVTGVVLSARDGTKATLKTDDSVRIEDDGRIVALTDGVLSRGNGRVSIQKRLVVKNNVDFSTGNVDFQGDVHIQKDVRDCFSVKATGSVDVAGRVEAATVECGGDLIAHGGATGRNRGSVQVGGDLLAKYLDAVQGRIGGDLKVQREVLNCDLLVLGHVQSSHGSIIGGRLTVQGRIRVATLGSPAAVPTELILDTVPRLEPFAVELQRLIERIDKQRTLRQQELLQLKSLCVRGNVPEPIRQQLAQLLAVIRRLDQQYERAKTTIDALHQRIAEHRTFDVTVERCIHAGVMLTLGGRSYRITNDLKGPVTFRRDANGVPIYVRGDHATGLLAQISSSRVADKAA